MKYRLTLITAVAVLFSNLIFCNSLFAQEAKELDFLENGINTDGLLSIHISPDNTYLVTEYKKYIMLFDIKTGEKIKTFRSMYDLGDIKISPNSDLIVSYRDNDVLLLNVKSEQVTKFKGHDEPVTSVDISSDGKSIISGSKDKKLKHWDIISGKEIRTLGGAFSGHSDAIVGLDISYDDRYIVSMSQQEKKKTFIIWDLNTGDELKKEEIIHSGPIPTFLFLKFNTITKDILFRKREASPPDYINYDFVHIKIGVSIFTDTLYLNDNYDEKGEVVGAFNSMSYSYDDKFAVGKIRKDNSMVLISLKDYSTIKTFKFESLIRPKISMDNKTIIYADKFGVHALDIDSNKDSKLIPGRYLSGTGINETDGVGNSRLHLAVKNDDVEYVKQLINNGINIDAVNSMEKTALHYVNDLKMAKVLVENGADKNIKDSNNKTATALAMQYGQLEIFNYLNSNVIPQPVVINKVIMKAEIEPVKRDSKKPIIIVNSPSAKRALKRTSEYPSKQLKIKGSITDDSKISRASVNKKSIYLDAAGNFETTVNLRKGLNTFEILAEDKFGNLSKVEIKLNVAGFKDTSITSKLNWYAKQYAVIVGVDNYKTSSIPALRNAVNDAKKLSAIFKSQGFEVTSLYNEKATKRNILKAMQSVNKIAKKQDNFIFYFAGHGQGLTLDTKDKVGYLLPYDSDVDLASEDVFDYDASAISLSQIRKYAKSISSRHVAILLDSCFSGLAMKRSIPKSIKYNLEYYNDVLSRKSINILTAGDDQPVSDGSGHSPFTAAIIEGIEKKGIDVNDRDGLATFTELATYVKLKVEKATNREQRPQFDNLSHEDGDFLFRLE